MIIEKKCTTDKIYSNEALALIKKPAQIKLSPSVEYFQNYKYFAMQASIEITKKGRLWSCWIGGEDGSGAYLIATYSDDRGESWNNIKLIIDPHNDNNPFIMNTHIGCLWQDPLGRLWLFYQQSFGMWDGEGANYAIICDNPDAEEPIWSDPKYISIGASLKKPIVTSKGEWLLPVSVWERWHVCRILKKCHTDLDSLRGAHVYASVDQGETWHRRGGITFKDSQFNEHSIVELCDGRIMMYSRCQSIKKSYSSDWGITWTPEKEAFPHVGSLAMIRTLPSGNILLIKHGESFDTAPSSRCKLCAFVSKDGGECWLGGLMLDEREGVSYPDIAIADDGTVFVQYDRERTVAAEILFARFKEEDVLAREFITEGSGTKFIIKDKTGIKGHPAAFPDTEKPIGSGTKNDPILIEKPQHLSYVAKSVSSGISFDGMFLEQRADIDFGGTNIQPIGYFLQHGSNVAAFRGHYDGKGYSISNFTQIAPELHTRALFGYVTAGSIKNVNIENAYFKGRNNTAALIGWADSNGENEITVSSCSVGKDVSVIGYEFLGGIVGRADGNVAVTDCHNSANIYSPFTAGNNFIHAGGIAGFAKGGKISFTNNLNDGSICSRNADIAHLGGIAGTAENSHMESCINNGTVSSICCIEHICAGGICGNAVSATESQCQNNGKIELEGAATITSGEIFAAVKEKIKA